MPFSHTLTRIVLSLLLMCLSHGANAGARVDQIMARGTLLCGVSDDVPGFSLRHADGRFVGLEADLCRAIAAAMLGSADKLQFVPLRSVHEFLEHTAVDVVFHRLTWTLTREAPGQLEFGPIYFYDKLIDSTDLADRFDPQEGAAIVSTLGHDRNEPSEFIEPIESIEPIEPLAPLLRSDDVDFIRIVRWTIYALMEAEALGTAPTHWPALTGAALGLPEEWARRTVAQVGHYADLYQRHFAGRPRGPNRLSRDGGLLAAPPLR